jgi:SAM-dependent methyltransferase
MRRAHAAAVGAVTDMDDVFIKRLLRRTPFARPAWHFIGRQARYVAFLREFCRFRRRVVRSGSLKTIRWRDRLPCLEDRTTTAGFDRHYVYHPAWAARILARTRPELHIDISSTLYFVSLVSAFLPVKFYDYRPADLQLSGLSCERADLLALPFPDRSVRSLSCMHVVEHVGLGRYGDPLDPEGDRKAMRELQRVVAPGGDLLFVVPVGKPLIRFNGHRIYAYEEVVHGLPELELVDFTLIPEASNGGPPIPNATAERVGQEDYGCGCFWMRQPS